MRKLRKTTIRFLNCKSTIKCLVMSLSGSGGSASSSLVCCPHLILLENITSHSTLTNDALPSPLTTRHRASSYAPCNVTEHARQWAADALDMVDLMEDLHTWCSNASSGSPSAGFTGCPARMHSLARRHKLEGNLSRRRRHCKRLRRVLAGVTASGAKPEYEEFLLYAPSNMFGCTCDPVPIAKHPFVCVNFLA